MYWRPRSGGCLPKYSCQSVRNSAVGILAIATSCAAMLLSVMRRLSVDLEGDACMLRLGE